MAIHMRRIDELALITLDRPEALNALSFALLGDLNRQLDSIAESDWPSSTNCRCRRSR